MFDRIKRWGEIAAATSAVAVLFSAVVAFLGGHLPPWTPYAWAQTAQQSIDQNALAVQQLRTLIISDKVAQLQTYVAANPGDVRARQELSYWSIQLQQAMQQTLPRK